MPTPSIGSLLTNLTREPGRPRITWYGPDSERVELSGAVLENWVNKTTNLLVEEFDAGPGTRVLLDLPGHWRTVVWALAVWRAGACVVLEPSAGGRADVVVTTDPGAHPGAAELVAVSLPALARRFDGDVPPGAIDATAAVMTYGDAIGWAPEADGAATALIGPGGAVAHDALIPPVDEGRPGRPRVHVPATGTHGGRSVQRVLVDVLGALAANGSVVLTCDVEPDRMHRLLAQEGALTGA
ncbi:TIGR03089 family protein [Cellulomonas soli]|uniref:TIGR03089 family protein n=1 Tax=Cellulomonas soli TaxID=931535 RepID=UPI0017DCF654|nr:TIGR03089 family protein [Cellulomonas soli]NYI57534.1 uncharacterized protein (TIGR03089 family) [Cellulomonas soli]